AAEPQSRPHSIGMSAVLIRAMPELKYFLPLRQTDTWAVIHELKPQMSSNNSNRPCDVLPAVTEFYRVVRKIRDQRPGEHSVCCQQGSIRTPATAGIKFPIDLRVHPDISGGCSGAYSLDLLRQIRY